MSDIPEVELATRRLGAVIEYNKRIHLLQKAIRQMNEQLNFINSQDTELINALHAVSELLPAKIEKSDDYIAKNKAIIEKAVNDLLGEI